MLFLVSYVFLLRMPSEALPMVTVGGGIGAPGEQSVIYLEDEVVHLKLAKRKNRQKGSLLKRSCWCKACRLTCPVHVLWQYLSSQPAGFRPFEKISAAKALCRLRDILQVLKVPEFESYRTHDFRRGHARDMQADGASLGEILAAGQWRSPAFMSYMEYHELEHDAVVEAHLVESSDEDV